MNLQESISEYCSSEYFMFLNPALKEYAEAVLNFWVAEVSSPDDLVIVDTALKKCGALDLPLDVKKAVPEIVIEFYNFLEMTGLFPDVPRWLHVIENKKQHYQDLFRSDGSLKGTTHKKNYTDVGRNDPCPCGSGKKFKKCCMNIF